MSDDSVSNSTLNPPLNVVMNHNMRTSGSYIFAPDGLILAYPETSDGPSNCRYSDTDIHHITGFLFGTLMKNVFFNL